MINDTTFMTNITKYYNYLERPLNKFKEPVTVLPNITLISLFITRYENRGNFMYEINKY